MNNITPLDRKSQPDNILDRLEKLEREIAFLKGQNIEAREVSEVVEDANVFTEDFGNIYTAVVSKINPDQLSFTLPTGILTDQNVIDVEVKGWYYCNIGALTLQAYCSLGVEGDAFPGDTVTSANGWSVGAADLKRGWRFHAQIFASPSGGLFTDGESEFMMEHGTAGSVYNILDHWRKNISGTSATSLADLNRLSFLFAVSSGGSPDPNRCMYFVDTITVRVSERKPIYNDVKVANFKYYGSAAAAHEDTFINSGAPTTAEGALAYIRIGENNSNTSVNRGLMRCSEITNIPPTATITAVKLYLVPSSTALTNQVVRSVDIFKCLRPWTGAGATWNTYDGTNAWNTAGCGGAGVDYENTVCATFDQGTAYLSGWCIAITFNAAGIAMVQGWVDGSVTNNGILLRAQTEANDAVDYHSSELVVNGEALSPCWYIEYTL